MTPLASQYNSINPRSTLTPLSLADTVNDLKQRGYVFEFRRQADCLFCIDKNAWVTPDGFDVEECYFFEDSFNMDKDRVLYAIACTEGTRGYLVDTCFVYEDNISADMYEKLNPGADMPGKR